eukprot:CAMPEP_0172878402 /NCGR_PEP_ID=MMETSP1075-20121228/109558_1 /TAXON_ID=2916 /ORGANISM="Ceratium fusus, Strain PA161109" /LENGTH=32 /DNA_ID= /DNA_START= /DNA_END= /DNA_ORIENTATION=
MMPVTSFRFRKRRGWEVQATLISATTVLGKAV